MLFLRLREKRDRRIEEEKKKLTLDPPLLSSQLRYLLPGDVTRPAAMTTKEFVYAQSLSKKPVKGMLTGPVTILNWSFPRKDITRQAQAYQLALALRDEVADLEKAGCRVIQVDEPALREGLPLKKERWASYLDWAVDAFKLATVVAAPATQIVTHLCYSEFADILAAIDGLDADVLTIENSRSGDEMVIALAKYGYARDLGAGVYDVHSPVVPVRIEEERKTGGRKRKEEKVQQAASRFSHLEIPLTPPPTPCLSKKPNGKKIKPDCRVHEGQGRRPGRHRHPQGPPGAPVGQPRLRPQDARVGAGAPLAREHGQGLGRGPRGAGRLENSLEDPKGKKTFIIEQRWCALCFLSSRSRPFALFFFFFFSARCVQ